MGFLSKLVKKLDPIGSKLGIGVGSKLDPIGKALGLGGSEKALAVAQTGAVAAQDEAKAQADLTAARTAEYQKSLQNMQQESMKLSNANADTTSGSVASIVAGGAANLANDATKKRKPILAGIGASLGINV